jgi:hypothetical protein
MYHQKKTNKVLETKTLHVEPFFKNGIQQPNLEEFLSFLQNPSKLGINSTTLAKKPFVHYSLVKIQGATTSPSSFQD